MGSKMSWAARLVVGRGVFDLVLRLERRAVDRLAFVVQGNLACEALTGDMSACLALTCVIFQM